MEETNSSNRDLQSHYTAMGQKRTWFPQFATLKPYSKPIEPGSCTPYYLAMDRDKGFLGFPS